MLVVVTFWTPLSSSDSIPDLFIEDDADDFETFETFKSPAKHPLIFVLCFLKIQIRIQKYIQFKSHQTRKCQLDF